MEWSRFICWLSSSLLKLVSQWTRLFSLVRSTIPTLPLGILYLVPGIIGGKRCTHHCIRACQVESAPSANLCLRCVMRSIVFGATSSHPHFHTMLSFASKIQFALPKQTNKIGVSESSPDPARAKCTTMRSTACTHTIPLKYYFYCMYTCVRHIYTHCPSHPTLKPPYNSMNTSWVTTPNRKNAAGEEKPDFFRLLK